MEEGKWDTLYSQDTSHCSTNTPLKSGHLSMFPKVSTLLCNVLSRLFSSTTGAGDELSLSVILTVPTHTLLHSLSTSSSSHKIAVTFDLDSDPTYPLLQIFGRGKQLRPSATVSNQKGGVKVCHPVKQSIAIAPILLNPKFKGLKEADNISPIEPTQDSPTVGHKNTFYQFQTLLQLLVSARANLDHVLQNYSESSDRGHSERGQTSQQRRRQKYSCITHSIENHP